MKQKNITIKDLLLLANGNEKAEVIITQYNNHPYDNIGYVARKNVVCEIGFKEGDVFYSKQQLELSFLLKQYPVDMVTYRKTVNSLAICQYRSTEELKAFLLGQIDECEKRITLINDSEDYTEIGKQKEQAQYLVRMKECKDIIQYLDSHEYKVGLKRYLEEQKSAPHIMISFS